MEPHTNDAGKTISHRGDQIAVSSGAILDRWSEYHWLDAVSLHDLSPLDRIVVTTHNHTYEIIVASPTDGTVLVRGGTAFPDFVVARLLGSSLGGSTIKLRTIAADFRMELARKDRWLITTPVERIALIPGRASRSQVLTS